MGTRLAAWPLVAVACASPSAYADTETPFLEDRVIVKFRRGATDALPLHSLPEGQPELDELCRLHRIANGRRVVRDHGVPVRDPELFREIGLDRIYLLQWNRPDADRVRELVASLSRRAWVEYAEPVYRLHPLETIPDDPLFPQQWTHENTGQSGGVPDADIDSPEAWDSGTGDPQRVIAILDTGVDEDHPDLVDNLLPGLDLTGLGMDDTSDHGTAVAAVAGARGNNLEGVAGVCWSCSILPIKFFSTGFGSVDLFVEAVVFAADSGADSINFSFSGVSGSQASIDAVSYGLGLGMLSVAAVGNVPDYLPFQPAIFPNVVAVGGNNDDGSRYGTYGEHLEVTAPTGAITARAAGTYDLFGGTSGAAPMVSGLAALLRSVDPGLHVQEIRQLILLGAEDQVGDPSEDTPGWDRYHGYGRINAAHSMALIDGPWLALDRPHYLCDGELHVDVKDKSAGATVDVSITGSVGGDVETVSAAPVTADGYYRGTIELAWDGAFAIPGNGLLEVVDGETLTASLGGLSATAFLDCLKRICAEDPIVLPDSGDCDGDGIADPGESWTFAQRFLNLQTEIMPGGVTTLTTPGGSIEMLVDSAAFDDFSPIVPTDPVPFAFRVLPGAPPSQSVSFEFSSTGPGWASDPADCDAAGNPNGFLVFTNRDPGGPESWPAFPPGGLTGSTESCPVSFDLTWDPVGGAAGYEVYRSEISCAEAETSTTPLASTATTSFDDTTAVEDVQYYYAVEGIEALTDCVTLRSCIPGGCLCAVPADPSGLAVGRSGSDVHLSWDDPGTAGITWNVYREVVSDPSVWGPPLATGVVDADPGTPGIQYTDTGGVAVGSQLFYRATAVNVCGESSLP